jgi:hypothetical protein
MLDALAIAQPTQDLLLLRVQLRRHDQQDRLAYRFRGAVAEDARRAAVPRLDDALERLADDGIVGGFHDGPELRAQAHDALLRVDIAQHFQSADDAAGAIAHRRDAQGNLHAPAVLRDTDGLDMIDPLAALHFSQ